MSKKVAVAIAISKAGNLTDLPGALNGAREFSDWASKNSYETHLITDEKRKIKVRDIKKLIESIVEDGADRLVVYFAGHGIEPSVNTPYWLLSDWEKDSDEAVNVNLSFMNAKGSGIAQIAVFADACRSRVPTAETVGGSSIFPKQSRSVAKQPQWDHFLACRLGAEAQEVPGTDATTSYGIFTRSVMRALNGEAPAAIEKRPGEIPEHVVTSDSLADYLESAVPFDSGITPGASVQFVEVISGWRRPKDVYFGLSPESTRSLVGIGGGPKSPNAAVVDARKFLEEQVQTDEKIFAAAEGRETFETKQGLTIVGAEPIAIMVRRSEAADLFEEKGVFHIRGHGGKPQTAMVCLENHNWVAAAILPEFVGTIVVKDGVAASITYAPTRYSYLYDEMLLTEVTPVIHRWTALMNQRRFIDSAGLESVAKMLRMHKHANPSLGILAAYAYERAGRIDEIDSIVGYFARAGQPIPFDVAYLSTYLTTREGTDLKIKPHDGPPTLVANRFPLMTQGWTFLDSNDKSVHTSLQKFRRGLVPSLWTTFNPDEGKEVAKFVYEEEL